MCARMYVLGLEVLVLGGGWNSRNIFPILSLSDSYPEISYGMQLSIHLITLHQPFSFLFDFCICLICLSLISMSHSFDPFFINGHVEESHFRRFSIMHQKLGLDYVFIIIYYGQSYPLLEHKETSIIQLD